MSRVRINDLWCDDSINESSPLIYRQAKELAQRLKKISDTLYAKGAPLGSDEYFTIRQLIIGAPEED